MDGYRKMDAAEKLAAHGEQQAVNERMWGGRLSAGKMWITGLWVLLQLFDLASEEIDRVECESKVALPHAICGST